jgi:hypothetical protein
MISLQCLPALLALAQAGSIAPPAWSQYGKNAQHTALVTTGVQSMKAVLWSTTVDPAPPTTNSEVLCHYASALVASGGTVVVTVRTGPASVYPSSNDTFMLQGHNPDTGAVIWTENTDYTSPAHGWTPVCGSSIGPDNRLYTPGAGGTVYVRSNADSPSATVSQLCFYGISTYNANKSAFNKDIRINTPITVDTSGNIYFGYVSEPTATTGMHSGLVRISSAGVATHINGSAIVFPSNPPYDMALQFNEAPALSNDGANLYVALKEDGYDQTASPTLVRLNSTTLSTLATVPLVAPAGLSANMPDDGTSSPLVGPDGDVFFGIWSSNVYRGFTLHFDSTLKTSKIPSAFGWDDTPSIVPASTLGKWYTGTSSYLLLSKYNNYINAPYGNGINLVSILDPNASLTYQFKDANSGNLVSTPTMKQAIGVIGVTHNAAGGVTEWCINSAAIDVAGKAAIINSEDGHSYRWDFTSNRLTDNLALQPPTGEAYTSTIVDKDGKAYAVNNATLYAFWDNVKPGALTFSPNPAQAGTTITATVSLTAAATGPGATLSLSTSDARMTVPATVQIPAGATKTTFQVQLAASATNYSAVITAKRYSSIAKSVTLTVLK